MIFIGAVALFIYGLNLVSENLQSLSAEKIRNIFQILSNKPYWGVFLGIALTVIFQSSAAVTTMLVGLGAAKVVNLSQVMSLILGTAIGSTITVQLLSFNISKYGLALFGIAFFVNFFSRRRVIKEWMATIMGFGLLFWGLELIRFSTKDLGHSEAFVSALKALQENPFLTLAATGIFTAIVHSSAVTIGLAMALTGHNLISIHDSIFWIFGANIGTTATALIAATGANTIGKRVAWAHCFYKIASVIVFLPVSTYLADWLTTGALERDVANLNTAYNCLAALLFYPGVNAGARFIQSLIPISDEEKEFGVQFLKKSEWESPSIIAAYAEREILRMSDIVLSMIRDSLIILRKGDPDLVASIRKRDDQTDILSRELNLYLAQNLEQAPQAIQMEMIRLMNYSADLESSADVVDNQLLELSAKTHTLKVIFPEDGLRDLEEMYTAVMQVSEMAICCFQTRDRELASKVIFHKREIRKMEQKMREAHISRMVKGSADSINTSSIHLDVLGEYRRIVGLMSNHVYSLLKENDPYNVVPHRE